MEPDGVGRSGAKGVEERAQGDSRTAPPIQHGPAWWGPADLLEVVENEVPFPPDPLGEGGVVAGERLNRLSVIPLARRPAQVPIAQARQRGPIHYGRFAHAGAPSSGSRAWCWIPKKDFSR